ncbi:MAG: helix-turn-helix domain-containing protein [Steroidobacteraceae bacterium]
MSRSRIGGALDMHALALLADRDRHRPLDAPTLRAAAVELSRRGRTPRDIAASLGLSEAAVRQLLSWERA